MITLNNLKSPKGSHRNTKRPGRGQGQGQGCQAGKGHKGQKARSGGGVRTGFIGGAMPLYMRLPKRGFLNAPFKKKHALVSLAQLEAKFESSEKVTREALIEKKILKGQNRNRTRPIKILGNTPLTKSLTLIDVKCSQSAKDSIEKAGGTIMENQKELKDA